MSHGQRDQRLVRAPFLRPSGARAGGRARRRLRDHLPGRGHAHPGDREHRHRVPAGRADRVARAQAHPASGGGHRGLRRLHDGARVRDFRLAAAALAPGDTALSAASDDARTRAGAVARAAARVSGPLLRAAGRGSHHPHPRRGGQRGPERRGGVAVLRARDPHPAGLPDPHAADGVLLSQGQDHHRRVDEALPAERQASDGSGLGRCRHADRELRSGEGHRDRDRVARHLPHLRPDGSPVLVAARRAGRAVGGDSLRGSGDGDDSGGHHRLLPVGLHERIRLDHDRVRNHSGPRRQRAGTPAVLRGGEPAPDRHHHRGAHLRRAVGILGSLLRHTARDPGAGGTEGVATCHAACDRVRLVGRRVEFRHVVAPVFRYTAAHDEASGNLQPEHRLRAVEEGRSGDGQGENPYRTARGSGQPRARLLCVCRRRRSVQVRRCLCRHRLARTIASVPRRSPGAAARVARARQDPVRRRARRTRCRRRLRVRRRGVRAVRTARPRCGHRGCGDVSRRRPRFAQLRKGGADGPIAPPVSPIRALASRLGQTLGPGIVTAESGDETSAPRRSAGLHRARSDPISRRGPRRTAPG